MFLISRVSSGAGHSASHTLDGRVNANEESKEKDLSGPLGALPSFAVARGERRDTCSVHESENASKGKGHKKKKMCVKESEMSQLVREKE
jgi:hypothetical protein